MIARKRPIVVRKLRRSRLENLPYFKHGVWTGVALQVLWIVLTPVYGFIVRAVPYHGPEAYESSMGALFIWIFMIPVFLIVADITVSLKYRARPLRGFPFGLYGSVLLILIPMVVVDLIAHPNS